MLISVIVPVYNTAQYLPVCLDSIIWQTYQNIEVILVDDGSTDESLQICTDYANVDSRIILLKKKHEGLVAARKAGVEKSSGKYCIFVDSDDWIAKNLLESILPLTVHSEIDVICYGMKSINYNKTSDWCHTIPEGVYEQQHLSDIYERMMFDFNAGCPGIIQSLCTKFVKRNLLLKSINSVDNRISIGEDAAVTYKLLLGAKKIAITNATLYFYRTRQGSMCLSKDNNIFTKIYFFKEYMNIAFSGYDEQYRLKEQLQAYLLLLIRIGMDELFEIKMRALYHIPFPISNLGKRIALYGAGSVGKSYYRQLLQTGEVELVAWVDKGLAGEKIYNYPVYSPNVLEKLSFDILLIAVKDRNVAMEIKVQLNNFIPEKKLLWKEPQIYWWEKEIDL